MYTVSARVPGTQLPEPSEPAGRTVTGDPEEGKAGLGGLNLWSNPLLQGGGISGSWSYNRTASDLINYAAR